MSCTVRRRPLGPGRGDECPVLARDVPMPTLLVVHATPVLTDTKGGSSRGRGRRRHWVFKWLYFSKGSGPTFFSRRIDPSNVGSI